MNAGAVITTCTYMHHIAICYHMHMHEELDTHHKNMHMHMTR